MINDIIIVDIFGINYHDFSLIGINSHNHIGAVIMEDSKFLVDIIMSFENKNDIIHIKEKSIDHTSKPGIITSCSFQTLF